MHEYHFLFSHSERNLLSLLCDNSENSISVIDVRTKDKETHGSLHQ